MINQGVVVPFVSVTVPGATVIMRRIIVVTVIASRRSGCICIRGSGGAATRVASEPEKETRDGFAVRWGHWRRAGRERLEASTYRQQMYVAGPVLSNR